MTIYIALESIPYEGGYILGVYSTHTQAENRLNEYKRDMYFEYSVKEIELDTPQEISI